MAASDRHSGNPFPLRSFLISARARGRRDLLARAPAAWEPSDLGTHREWMMMKRMTWAGAAAVALLMATFGAGNLQAQASTASTDEGDRIAKAEKLESEARDAASDRESFGDAIRLYREAADLRGDDPGAIADLIMAGKLAYYVGHKGQAVDHLARAGEIALEWGDVLTAAQSFLDAAWVADREGHDAEAYELGRRAEKLSASPLIQRQERVSILSRIADLMD